jgi:flagellar hook-associated protein 2
MASIVSSGIGSGLDIDGLVKQLVAAEGAPTATRLNTQEAKLQAKLSAFGSLRGAIDSLAQSLAPLKDLSKLQSRAASSADEGILTASADSTAAPGTYAIEVERLAQAAKLRSGPFATVDTVVGTGTLTLKLGTSTLVLTIDSTHNTLAQIRDAINSATGNPGISATIVTGTDGPHLVLSGTKTGAVNALTVTQAGGDGGLAAITYDPTNGINFLTQLQGAVDSRVVVDGLPLEGPTNSVSGAVTGLTLTLVGVSDPDVTTSISVSFDKAATTKAVNDFAKAYNSLVTGLKPLSTFDAKTKVAGPLLGDSTLRDFLTAVRRSLTATVSSATAYTNLSQIGFSFAFDGTLSVDATKLGAAIDGNFDAVGKLFSSTDGIAKRLDALVSQYTTSGGLLEARTKGLETSIDDIGDQRVVLQGRLDALQTRLRVQFNAMDTLVAQLKSTSNFLTQQLSASATAIINRI